MNKGIQSGWRAICSLTRMAVVLTAVSTSVDAHEEYPHTWTELSRSWSFEPVVVVALLTAAVLFVLGFRKRTAKTSGHRLESWSFVTGWFALFIALVSPLHAWGSVLFSAHMSQHEVLMLVAAPLLVLSRPLVIFSRAIPLQWSREISRAFNRGWLKSTWRFITLPLVAWLVHAIALWVWHIPTLFEAVQTSELVHSIQHSCFLFSALLFWWSLIHGRQGVMGYGAALLYLFTTSLHSGALGALLSLSNSVWYPSYIPLTNAWGLTPLEDQQLGGLIMWIPAGFVYLFAAIFMFIGLMQTAEQRAQRLIPTKIPREILTEADS